MNCLQVREKVTEYAMGTLRGPDAQEVERHLEWCAGCRKEAAELQEGAAAVALALPEAEPPGHLEREIVERVATAAGRRKPRSRRGFWALAAATLSAMLVAVSAFGWALAERGRVTDLQVAVGQKSNQLQELQRLIDNVPNVRVAGRSLQAELRPLLRSGGFGRAVLFAASEGGGWVVVDVVPPEPTNGPYTVRVLDDAGKSLAGGALKQTNSGDWIYYEAPGTGLSEADSISVSDASSRPVLIGTLTPYEPSPTPGS